MKKLLTTLLLAAVTIPLWAADKPSRPNIVFILADDSGIDAYGCYGSDRFKGKTPHIDALAKSGIRFERCYAEPLCGPSRCQIMTGRYAFRTGGLSNPTAHQPSFKDEPSLAKTLKQAGYVTGMAGKWRQMGDSPGDWSFDEYITDPTAGGYYWKTSYTKNDKLVQTEQEVYCPDVCRDFAVDFFKRHRDEPFYFYYPTHLVHGPILRTPDSKPGAAGFDTFYNDNIAYLDKQVGQLVVALDALGLRERTLIVFSGDNGTAKQSWTIGGREINGHKGTMMEGGARVPLIANWKGTTPAGKVLKDLVDFSDFFPTFAEVAGAKMSEGVTFDGRSFAPQLRGQAGSPREWIYVQLGGRWYVRNDGWKLNQAGELFDMSDAPFVEKLVSADGQNAAAKAARQKLQAVLDELKPAAGKAATAPDNTKKAKKQRKRAKGAL
jgi:arylsulfatase A